MSINREATALVELLEARAMAWKDNPTGDPSIVEPLANGVIALAFVTKHYVRDTDHHMASCTCSRCQDVEWLIRALGDIFVRALGGT